MKKHLLAFIALIQSIVLGFLFVYLFTWKLPGISHLIFFTIVLAGSFIPLLVIDPQKLLKERTLALLAFPLFLVLTGVFLYRLDIKWIFLAYVSIPVLVHIYLAMLHVEGTLSNVGIFSYITLPCKIFFTWFVDLVNFVKKLSLKSIIKKKENLSSSGKKILIGLVISIPFVVFFLVMFSLADSFFAEKLGNFISSTFGKWFKDVNSFISFIGRFIVGVIISIYYSVFYFALWNDDSKLQKVMKKNIDKKVNLKKKWDVIIASTLLFVLNLVFVIFVIFQFVYFFGGSENIVGDNAGFTYAEYARKGFWELLFVSIVAYFIILILNLKVKIKGIIAKMVFYGNYILLSLSVLIINYSSYSRLRLYEEVYGFTVLRVLVFMAIIGIALQYIFLVVSPLVKDSYKFISLTTSFLVFIYYVIVVVMPLDYVVANLNMKRYRESGEIDVGYLLQLSDEAIPVLVDLTDEVSPSIKYVLLDELEYRYSIKEVHRDKWMSYNIWQERNDMMLKETLDEDKNWDIEARNQVQNIVDEYSQYIEDERFAEAYDEFWIEDAEKTEFLEDIEKQELEVVEYSIGENVYISQYGLRHGLNLPIEAKLTYIQKDDYSKRTVVKCLSGNLRLKLTGDGWKIVYEEIMPFGYIAGYGNYDMYHFEENSLNNYYMYYENKHTSWCD